jgi:hypothetical protein
VKTLVAVAAGCALFTAAWFLTPEIPRLDDGFISLHSAQSLIAGKDSHYGSPPLAGVTSPPYVLLIVGLLTIGLPPLFALKTATALGLAALVSAVSLLARASSLHWGQQLVLPVAVLISGPVLQHATNGVETGWAMTVAIALIAATLARRYTWCAVASGTLPWLRPDLAPMAGLLFLWAVWSAPKRTLGATIAVAVGVFAGWAAWLHYDTASWIPHSMSVKAAFGAEWCQPLSSKLRTTGAALGGWLLLSFPITILAAIWLFATALGRLGVAATLISLCAYTAILPGSLWFNGQRYLYALVVPWVALGIVTLMRSNRHVWHIVLAAAVVVNVYLFPRRLVSFDVAQDRVDAAIWINQNVDPRDIVMVQDAGAVAVFTANPLIDFVGLKSPASERVHQAITWPSCGHDRARALSAIARNSRARYLLITADWDRTFALTASLRSEGLRLDEVRPAPLANGYEIFRIEDTRGGG